MLVKLGDIWVDPTKVTHLDYSQIRPKILIGIINGDTCIASDGFIDEFAAIINNAIGQSYGGEDEENPANP